MIGLSINPICGAHDHATLLAEELRRDGSACPLHWLTRTERSVGGSRAEIRAWLRDVSAALHSDRPRAIVLHYSVFSYAHAGVPLFLPMVLRALRASGVPVITVLHEYAYPWRRGGARGVTWALTQRLALAELVRASAALLLTTDSRVHWIGSRRWLPARPLAVAPVFSNLPAPTIDPLAGRRSGVVGLFGYAYDPAAAPLVLDATRRLVGEGHDIRLELLGAPGGSSPSAATWREAAQARGLAQNLSFSGTLPAQELSNALSSCELLLFAARPGPSSRKGTLAASLASGRPVVATNGPNRWEELVASAAAIVVEPNADALAEAIGGLLADEAAREALGERSLAFSTERMGVARTATAVRELIAEATLRRAP
jgi:glycosyltransferase involved in cell wall biosynthesis